MVSFLSLSKLASAAFGVALLAAIPGNAILADSVVIQTPTWEPLYDGVLIFTPNPLGTLITSPYGSRGLVGVLGGNITNATTGELEGTVLPGYGGELGLYSNITNKLYPDVRVVFQWEDDQTHAFFVIQGIANVTETYMSTTESVWIETNSPTRQNLVDNMCLLSILVHPVHADPTTNVTYGNYRVFGKTSWNPLPASEAAANGVTQN